MNDINCPYCNKPQDVDRSEGYGTDENTVYQKQCEGCDKYFTFSVGIIFVYHEEKADCLNGSPHNWEPTITIPKKYTQMRCTMCYEERKLTPEEREAILKTNIE